MVTLTIVEGHTRLSESHILSGPNDELLHFSYHTSACLIVLTPPSLTEYPLRLRFTSTLCVCQFHRIDDAHLDTSSLSPFANSPHRISACSPSLLSFLPPSQTLSTNNPKVMATNIAAKPVSVTPRVVTISNDHDLTLRVTEYTKPLKTGEDGHDKIKAIVDFKVTRQYLVDNSKSEVLKKLLTTREFAEAGKKIINLDEHNPVAIEAILCGIYRKNETWTSSTLGQEVTARTLSLDLDYLWDVVFSNRFLIIEFHHLDAWFALWYEKNGHRYGTKLLYPCLQFNHAKGFLSITRTLVYDHAHIEEYKNKKHPDLHVPPRVIRKFCVRQISSCRSPSYRCAQLCSRPS